MSNTTTTRTAGDTSKAKPQIAKDLGMTLAAITDMSICWVPVPLTDKDKELVRRVAESRSTDDFTVKAHRVLHDIARKAFDSSRVELTKEAEKVAERIAVEETVESLNSKMESLQRKLALMQEAAKKQAAQTK